MPEKVDSDSTNKPEDVYTPLFRSSRSFVLFSSEINASDKTK